MVEGKHVLLTGASRGIGAAVAEALAHLGADLSLVARSAEGLARTAETTSRSGARTVVLPADITSAGARQALLARARAAFGPVDILVSSAGVHRVGPFADEAAHETERLVQTNLLAPLALARLVLPDMLARGWGRIVLIASLSGKLGIPYLATYSATKAALVEWTHAMCSELHGTDVRCTAICPGLVSEVGMFARYGRRPPAIMGATPPAHIADAVLAAICRQRTEMVLNPVPVRPLLALRALLPSAGATMLRWLGITARIRRFAEEASGNGGRTK